MPFLHLSQKARMNVRVIEFRIVRTPFRSGPLRDSLLKSRRRRFPLMTNWYSYRELRVTSIRPKQIGQLETRSFLERIKSNAGVVTRCCDNSAGIEQDPLAVQLLRNTLLRSICFVECLWQTGPRLGPVPPTDSFRETYRRRQSFPRTWPLLRMRAPQLCRRVDSCPRQPGQSRNFITRTRMAVRMPKINQRPPTSKLLNSRSSIHATTIGDVPPWHWLTDQLFRFDDSILLLASSIRSWRVGSPGTSETSPRFT